MHPAQVFIFSGPTLSPREAGAYLDAIYLPPARLGDIYRVCELYQPAAIGIIDGYFNQVPAIWHKELLQAMQAGVELWGASSMGALRAAELHPLGMRGVGEIFKAFQDGSLPPFDEEVFEDDDEVAVIHGPAELGYPSLSEALVNIRYTLAYAYQSGVIDRALMYRLSSLAKQAFYAERSYAGILAQAADQGVPDTTLTRLDDWLARNRIDQKKRDAIELLKAIDTASKHRSDLPENSSTNGYQLTHQWQAAINDIEASHRQTSPVLDELRLQGEAYFSARARVQSQPPGGEDSREQPSISGLTDLHASPEQLQRRFSRDWLLLSNQVNSRQLSALQLDQLLLSYLEKSGEFKPLQARAERKRSVLAEKTNKPRLETLNELQRLQLSDWYFNNCLNSEMPDELEAYSESLDLEALEDFYAMILDEYLYRSSELS